MTEELKAKIAAIPGDEDGWWKSGSQEKYEEAAEKLLAKGFSEDEAAELLEDLYFAATDCFGG